MCHCHTDSDSALSACDLDVVSLDLGRDRDRGQDKVQTDLAQWNHSALQQQASASALSALGPV
jgi:hypothetical protein